MSFHLYKTFVPPQDFVVYFANYLALALPSRNRMVHAGENRARRALEDTIS